MSAPADPPPRRRIAVEIEPGSDGQPPLFALSCGTEVAVLAPSKTWMQVDHFKWVTRGIIEPPQSFAVHPDGSVEYNGDTFHPQSPDAAQALEAKVNQKHLQVVAPQPSESPSPRGNRHQHHNTFRVRLDHLSHILVEAFRGSEHTETGLRGLARLAVDGWMRPPRSLHVDPLQRYLELDGVRFPNNAEGAQALEAFLNRHFVPESTTAGGHAIAIRENPAASTGFDIQFWTVRAGARFEVRGHLSQEKLDLLQDHDKCDLLQPGILLRISPPYLYIRRRRHDGSEDHVTGIPDIKYRTISAADLERLLNHPLIRNPATLPTSTTPADDPQPATSQEPAPPPAAPAPTPTPFVPPAKTPPPRATTLPTPHSPTRPPETPTAPPAIVAPPKKRDTPFAPGDPHETHQAIFRELAHRLHLPVQDLLLSLPRVFTDRRFEILDFNGEDIASVLQLRTAHFYGFYLTHLGPDIVDLVYACHGTHLEWGTHKCTVQTSARAEPSEFQGPALLGLAQDAAHHFAFVVSPLYRDWARAYETAAAEAYARFLTPDEWAEKPHEFPLIWPPPTTA